MSRAPFENEINHQQCVPESKCMPPFERLKKRYVSAITPSDRNRGESVLGEPADVGFGQTVANAAHRHSGMQFI